MTDQPNKEYQKPPSDRIAWNKFWNDYCKHKGHKFVNRRCIYCQVWKDEVENEIKSNSD